jgi:hypothetical protein
MSLRERLGDGGLSLSWVLELQLTASEHWLSVSALTVSG